MISASRSDAATEGECRAARLLSFASASSTAHHQRRHRSRSQLRQVDGHLRLFRCRGHEQPGPWRRGWSGLRSLRETFKKSVRKRWQMAQSSYLLKLDSAEKFSYPRDEMCCAEVLVLRCCLLKIRRAANKKPIAGFRFLIFDISPRRFGFSSVKTDAVRGAELLRVLGPNCEAKIVLACER